MVHRGEWQTPGGLVSVAVKTLKDGASDTDRIKFLQEAAINGQFRHPNIVQLLGVVTLGDPVSSFYLLIRYHMTMLPRRPRDQYFQNCCADLVNVPEVIASMGLQIRHRSWRSEN